MVSILRRGYLTMPLVAVAVALGRAPAQPSSARPQVRHVSLSVPAGDSTWRSADVGAEPGDLVAIRASGVITIGRFSRDVDARGVPLGGGAAPGSVYLEYRIGEGASKPTGTSLSAIATMSGPLALRVRDTRYDDNAGAFTVDVIVVPATLIPDAREPGASDVAPTSDVLDYLRSFLKTFAVAQEVYFSDHARYAGRVSDLTLQLPAGVIVQALLLNERGTGWSVIARHENLARIRCAAAINMVNPLDTSAGELQAVCR